MTIRKAVILAAGFGTRFLPATKIIPKEMLPILDRPVIQYIVEEALAAGLDHIILVTNAAKRAIEQHFAPQPDLQDLLARTGKRDLLDTLERLSSVSLAVVDQEERRGNGHAVLVARHLIGDDPFAIFFPDDVIFHDVPAIKQLVDVHDRLGGTVLAVQQVPDHQISRYGIIAAQPIEPRLHRVTAVVEKPAREDAPSNLATVGRFVAGPGFLDVLAQTPPGRAGEIWLMDAFHTLAQTQPLYAYEFEGARFDCGNPLGLLQASLHQALRDQTLAPDLRTHLRALSDPANRSS